MSSATPTRGVRRIELTTARPEPVADFYSALLGWAVIAEPDGSFTGWVGDRLAVHVRDGSDGWRVVFAGPGPRELRPGAAVDSGRVLHGPWAPEPRTGEPSWVELMGDTAEDDYWTTELGWHTRTPGETFTVYDTTPGDAPRAIAGRLTAPDTGLTPGWVTYFAVTDADTAAATATSAGGTVLLPPRDTPTGVVAALADPEGAVFAILQNPAGWGGAWA
ncbi:VOC family protein [Actinosynnema sp. NPDC020468]|uniref:VOC family protein n=1 Tax=Actinosynnema sp. NPDC020468 TaxID=3154488 RepID=UPI0033E83DDC